MRLALFLTFVLGAPAFAARYVVIANPSLAGIELSAGDVKRIFLGSKTSVHGKRVEPVIARSGAAHDEFVSTCLGKSPAGLRNYFRMLIFSGKGTAPKSFAGAAEIVAYVAKTVGAIGYVSREDAAAGPALTAVTLLALKQAATGLDFSPCGVLRLSGGEK
jgi:hypothetical protein